MTFDRPEDTHYPVTAELAVERAKQMVQLPIRIAYPVSIAIGALQHGLGLRSFVYLPVAFVGCWLYWSYLIPRWRRWAAAEGIDPARLQEIGEKRQLIWPRGSLLEKTELR